MAERTNQNWEERCFSTLGPNFRIDSSNPQMGISGENVYQIYGVTDDKDQCFVSLSKSGHYKILNDRSIEISAGNKSKEEGADIALNGLDGGISLSCLGNGSVQLKGKNIIIDATEDVDIKAGRNISLTAGSTLKLKGMKVELDESSMLGNIVETVLGSFAMRVFSATEAFASVGADVISAGLSAATGTAESFAGNASATVASESAGAVNAPPASGETATENLEVGQSNTETQATAAAERDLIESQQAQTLQQGGTIVEGNTTTSFELL
jgi:hypothetical protein